MVELDAFENITRRAHLFTDGRDQVVERTHPFELRDIHDSLPSDVRELFDNGHYAQATFEAFKYLDREVARIAGISETGKSLMMKVFSETDPKIKLTKMATDSDRSEQEGYKFIFAGVMMAIRNPRGHEHSITDTMHNSLDHLSFASILARRIESAGFALASR